MNTTFTPSITRKITLLCLTTLLSVVTAFASFVSPFTANLSPNHGGSIVSPYLAQFKQYDKRSGTGKFNPVLSVTGSVGDLTRPYGDTSIFGTFTVGGTDLTNNISIVAPADFEVSLSTDPTHTYSSVVTLALAGHDIAPVDIYVRLAGSAVVGNVYSGDIDIESGTDAAAVLTIGASGVTPAPLTITALPIQRTYGTVIPVLTASPIFDVSGLVGSETITGVTLTPDAAGMTVNTPAGVPFTITPGDAIGDNGFLASNYSIIYQPYYGLVVKRPLNLHFTGVNKVYDGNPHAWITETDDRIPGDNFSLNFQGLFADSNVGLDKNVNIIITGFLVSFGMGPPDQSRNYFITTTTATTTAGITVAPLTVTAVTDSRLEDGTNTSAGVPVLTGGVASTDVVSTAAIQTYDTPAYGTGKTITPSGLVINDGNGGDNYAITYVPVTTGVIIPKTGVYSFSPTSGPAGTTVVLTGINFTGATAVTFGGLPAESYTVDSDTQITAITNGTTSGVVSVIAPAGTGVSTSVFTATFQPHITYAAGAKTFAVGSAITTLAPANNGGAVGFSTPGYVTTIAGHGWAGPNDGPALEANFNGPFGTATDAAGNVYIADTHNNSIRKISTSGYVSTFAGGGGIGSADGQGTAATFNAPVGVAVDHLGNVYVVDRGNNEIRKITAGGYVSTIAGNTTAGAADGTGSAASFNAPYGIAVDHAGNLYVTDHGNNMVRKIDLTGAVSTVAGSTTQGKADGTGTAASFFNPSGIAIAADGTLYVSDQSNNTIRKISAAGVVTTFAGSGVIGNADGTGVAASFAYPCGLALDLTGNLYVADGWTNNLIRKITPTGVVTTYAGSGVASSIDGLGAAATLNYPYGISTDKDGNLYVGESAGYLIRKVGSSMAYGIYPALPDGLSFNMQTGEITGTPTSPVTATDYKVTAYNISGSSSWTVNIAIGAVPPPAPVLAITSFTPTSAATGASVVITGKLFTGATAVTFGDTTTGGTAASSYTVDSDTQITAVVAAGATGSVTVTTPTGTVSATGFTYLTPGAPAVPVIASFAPTSATTGNSVIITGTGFTGSTAVSFGGTAAASYTVDSDTQITAVVAAGTSGAVDVTNPSGHIGLAGFTYITPPPPPPIPPAAPVIAYGGPYSYTTGTAIAPVTPVSTGGAIGSASAGTATTLAGTGYAALINGNGTAAAFNGVYATAVDSHGNVYVADAYNNVIRKITSSGDVTTLAGSGAAGAADGAGVAASFSKPVGVAVDAAGNVYVADQTNNAIRMITQAGVVSTLAGTYNSPAGVAVDGAGIVYVADRNNNQIKKITAGVVSTLAGTISAGKADGIGTAASFNIPSGVAVDAAGNVYVADQGNNQIRKISPAGVATTLAGSGAYGAADGTGTAASFGYPCGVAVDGANNVYVADGWSNNVIRQITPAGVVTTLPGTFKNPYGVAADAAGNLYVAETGGYIITKIGSSMAFGITPALPAGLTFNSLTGEISGTPTAGSPVTTYTITAYGAGGSASATLSIEVVVPLTFNTIAAVTYGDADFAPGAFSSFPITYSSGNTAVATIVGGQIHIKGAGSAVITATSNGDTATQTVTVNKAVITATADNRVKSAGMGNPPLSVKYTGFVNGETKTALTTLPVASSTADLSSPAGTYAITVSGGVADNYSFAYVPGTLTVLTLPTGTYQTNNNGVLNAPHVKRAVSPNGDGINDILTITNVADFPTNRLTIMNAAGNMIYLQHGYNNVNNVFDGHSNIYSAMQPVGTYLFVFEYNDNGVQKYETGYLVLKY